MSWQIVPRAYGFGRADDGVPTSLKAGPLLAAGAGYESVSFDAAFLPHAESAGPWLAWLDALGIRIDSVFLEFTGEDLDEAARVLAGATATVRASGDSARVTVAVTDRRSGRVGCDADIETTVRCVEHLRGEASLHDLAIDWHPHAVALERPDLEELVGRLGDVGAGVCLDLGWLARARVAETDLPGILWSSAGSIQFRDVQADGAWAEDFSDRDALGARVIELIEGAQATAYCVELFRDKATVVTSTLPEQAEVSLKTAQRIVTADAHRP
ncbi:hypothetical protein [Nocardioides sp. SYSU D00038]|uniref:hypothetical protein n=1 Tax=Nocardioides sp. SYSU D00038 TaxID=2812554 RepID=UPI001967B2C6|nr:hypothetical protein [Nocardioides sp. SYSU D00038]